MLIESNYNPTLIVGLGRGGAFAGSILTNIMGHRPFAVLDLEHCWLEKHNRRDFLYYDVNFDLDSFPELLKRVVIVSGEMNTSGSLQFAVRYLKNKGADQIWALTVYKRSEKEPQPSDNLNGIPHSVAKMTRKEFKTPWRNVPDYIYGETEKRNCTYIGKILLVRHAESQTNLKGNIFDDPVMDVDITEFGKNQARQLAAQLKNNYLINRIYCSQMKRALKTAEILSETLSVPIFTTPKLNEISFGEWAGKPYEQIKTERNSEYKKWRESNWNNAPFKEEMDKSLKEALAFLDDLGKDMIENRIDTILCVSHMNLVELIVSELKKTDKNRYRDIRIDNCSLTKLILFVASDGSINFSVFKPDDYSFP